jgi:hypothetical protein
MGFGEALHERPIAAIAPGQGDLVEELRGSQIKSSKALSAGLLSEGTSQEGLSDASRTADENILVLSDPVAGQKVHHDRFIDSPGSPVINILDRGLKFEFSLLEETFKAMILLPDPLAIHKDAEAFIEGQIVEGGLV